MNGMKKTNSNGLNESTNSLCTEGKHHQVTGSNLT